MKVTVQPGPCRGKVDGKVDVLTVQRVWPGVPFGKMHYMIGAILAYGLLIGVVGRV